MIDRIFSAALTFCVLVAATLAIGSAMLERGGTAAQPAQVEPPVVQLQRVEVIGKRAGPGTHVATAESAEAKAQRVQ